MAAWIFQEGEDDEGGDGGEVVSAEEPMDVAAAETAVSLETVVEEDDDEQLQDQQDRPIVHESADGNENSKLPTSTAPVSRLKVYRYSTASS